MTHDPQGAELDKGVVSGILHEESIAPARSITLRAFARKGTRVLSSFVVGQAPLQAIQVLIGFLLMRWLSVESWAQFGLASGLQLTMGTLMDLGLSTTIVPLVGNRRDDKQVVGRYVRSAKHLRDVTFAIIGPITVVAFVVVTYKQHWDFRVQALLLLSVLVALHSSGRMSCFSAPLLIFGRLQEFYLPQTLASVGRLLIYAVCHVAGVLNAWVATALYGLNVFVNGKVLEARSQRLLEWPDHDDRETDLEVIRYILPAAPAIIFAAFQSQISLFLIGFFGGTVNIAEVAALTRLNQLFAVLMTFNVVVIEPYIARLPQSRLLKNYLWLISATVAICVPIVLVGFFFPGVFLWLLGSNYRALGNLVGWVICSGCINQVAGLVWIMNRGRRWVFWSGTVVEIALLFAVQIGFMILIGVHTTSQAVFFMFVSSPCYVIAHGYVAVVGFARNSRQAGGETPPITEERA